MDSTALKLVCTCHAATLPLLQYNIYYTQLLCLCCSTYFKDCALTLVVFVGL